MNTRTFAFLTLLLAAVVESRLTHVTGSSQTLLQYGSAESSQHFLLQLDDDEHITSAKMHTLDTHILTSHELSVERISDTLSNISVTHMFDRYPGDVNYVLSVSTNSSTGVLRRHALQRKHSVYGMVFYQPHNRERLVSGDFGHGLDLAAPLMKRETVRLQYVAHAPGAQSDALQMSTHVIAHGAHGDKHKVLRDSDVSVGKHSLDIVLHKKRIGSALVMVECEGLVVHGESFETVIPVRVAHSVRRHDGSS